MKMFRSMALFASFAIAIPTIAQTAIGSPTSGGAVSDQTTGGYLSSNKLIEREVNKLKKLPSGVVTLLDPDVKQTQVEDAYRSFLDTGQRMSPIDFLANAKAMRQAVPNPTEAKAKWLTILQADLADAGLLSGKGQSRTDNTQPAFVGSNEGFEQRVKAAKAQLESEMKKK